jgi:hypothetical protein
MVSSFIRQALQYSRKAMKIHFQNRIKYIKTKYQKEKNMKKEQPQEKSSTSGKKIKLTKSNNVEQKNPTQKNMPGIIPNDIEIRISIIVKYVSI